MRLWLVSALLTAAGAFAATTAHADDELDVADSTDLRGDALVWEDATFYFEPWDGGTSVRLTTLGGRRTDEVGRAIPVRITSAAMRSFVEIELPERLDCVWRKWVPDRRVEALRLFVKREDLAPVLTKPFATSATDGTRVKLAPGVAVAPTTNGMYTVSVRGDKLRLAIPHASVGYVYTSTRVTEPELPAGKVYRLDRGATVRILGDELQTRASWLSPEPTKGAEGSLLHWATRCVELTVGVAPAMVRPGDRPRAPVPSGTGVAARPTGYYIPAGAPLSTTGGREVAVTGTSVPVGPPSGETSCFDANLSVTKIDDTSYPPYLTRMVRLCAPARLVERD
jgi:hypothetical protein